jgi:hypothetical protein
MSENIDELAPSEADLTEYYGIGKAISDAIREIVLSGTLGRLETLRSQVSPEVAALSEYPDRLDLSAAKCSPCESGRRENRYLHRCAQHPRIRTHSMRHRPSAAVGLQKGSVLNCLEWSELRYAIKR